MRLTLVQLANKKPKYKGITGNLTHGKYRIPYIYTRKHREEYIKDLTQESKNEMWLTRSYLNNAQENKLKVHTRDGPLGIRPHLAYKDEDYDVKNQRFKLFMKPNVSFEDKWKHLKDFNSWVDPPKVNSQIMRKYVREARACIPKKLPDFWPRAQEKWDEWNEVDGFGKQKNNKSLTVFKSKSSLS